jgi:hypothetical protein
LLIDTGFELGLAVFYPPERVFLQLHHFVVTSIQSVIEVLPVFLDEFPQVFLSQSYLFLNPIKILAQGQRQILLLLLKITHPLLKLVVGLKKDPDRLCHHSEAGASLPGIFHEGGGILAPAAAVLGPDQLCQHVLVQQGVRRQLREARPHVFWEGFLPELAVYVQQG